eukprot:CAMPEP_0171071844 /NCGR_PEP_ID=MMETSP0766_2-20121228/10535_1 /TAXON_ID=439317 /ORGANISM="Gambierdiscus australes, Strain CAWD 149" /LENGTH=480 /DNA_ID=CAMNT_0011528397 /DNA_START=48 /DNA_END=1491 /DNA_ORIENTATION=-
MRFSALWTGQCTVRSCRPCCFADPTIDTIKVETNKLGSLQGSVAEDTIAIADPHLDAWPGGEHDALQLLSRLDARLRQENLQFHDLPEVGDREFLLLLAELGFDSALERAKVRKAVRDFLALRCPADAKRSITTLSTFSAIDDEVASQLSSNFVPTPGAYYTGERVEYYSRRLRLWSPAEITAEARNGGQELVYSATVQPQNREFYDVSLAALRPPMIEGEPCEVLARGGWCEAVTSSGQMGSGTDISYRAVLLEGPGGELEVPAARLRRRFPPGSLVTVYRGPGVGWRDATVAAAPAGVLGATPEARQLSADRHCNGDPQHERPEWFTEVPVHLQAAVDERPLLVYSYLLRFRPEYLSQYALWAPVRREAVSTGCSNAERVIIKAEVSHCLPAGLTIRRKPCRQGEVLGLCRSKWENHLAVTQEPTAAAIGGGEIHSSANVVHSLQLGRGCVQESCRDLDSLGDMVRLLLSRAPFRSRD